MAVVASVPATCLNALLGRRMAPRSSARCARYRPAAGVCLVHGVFGRDDHHNSARTCLVQGFCQEIIMDAEVITVVSGVVHLDGIEGDVADDHIKELIRVTGMLEACNRDKGALRYARRWVRFPRRTAGKARFSFMMTGPLVSPANRAALWRLWPLKMMYFPSSLCQRMMGEQDTELPDALHHVCKLLSLV